MVIFGAIVNKDGKFKIVKQKDEIDNFLKRLPEGERKNYQVIKLKYFWNGNLEELEEFVLQNIDKLLSYPFIKSKFKFNNLKREVTFLRKYYKLVLGALKTGEIKTKTSGLEIPEKKREEIREKILLLLYNLIQEAIRQKSKEIPKLGNVERLPANSIFLNLQNLNKEVIKGGKTKLLFKIPELNTMEKAILQSLYYSLFFFISEEKNKVNENTYMFRLTDLMEAIGIPKREWGKEKKSMGYSREQKNEVLNLIKLINIKPPEAEVKKLSEEGREEIRKLLGIETKEGDIFAFTPVLIGYDALYDNNRNVKDANIIVSLRPGFNPSYIKTFKTNVFKSKLDDPHYRLLAIYLANGKRNGKITIKVRELYKISEIDTDMRHPSRSKDKIIKLLERAKDEGIIKGYKTEEAKTFSELLEKNITIFFEEDKKK